MEHYCIHRRACVANLTARLIIKTEEVRLLRVQQLWFRAKVATFKEESEDLFAQLTVDPNYEVQSRYHVAFSKYVFYMKRLERCDKRFVATIQQHIALMHDKTHLEVDHNIHIDIPLPPPQLWPP